MYTFIVDILYAMWVLKRWAQV